MNHLKTIIRNQENIRRRNFVLKLIFLFILSYLYEGETFLTPILVKYPAISAVLRALIFLLSSIIVISLGRFITLNFYLKRTDEARVHPNFVIGINQIASILTVFVVVISFMLAFGIRPLEFLTSITIVAAAIALLTKDYITNITNGLIIMFSDQFEIGDKIKVGNSTGFIRDITLINLILKTETGEIVIVPNTFVLSTEVINYSKNNSHQVFFDSEIPLHKSIELEELEKSLNEILKRYADLVYAEGAQLTVIERKPESIFIRYQFPIKSGEKAAEVKIKRMINQTLINWSDANRKDKLL